MASCLVVAVAFGLLPTSASGGTLTPDSPQVRAIIDRGVKYLLSSPGANPGERAIVGLALLKTGMDKNHPLIQEAAAMVDDVTPETETSYSVSVIILFLIELDPVKYRSHIEKHLTTLLNAQKPHGGWGYTNKSPGDTSMTQYAVLCLWEAERAGYPIPPESWERVAGWLMRTQDPSGAWGYQGVDPGSLNLVGQSDVRHSLAAAGLGSLYICLNQMKVSRAPPPEEEEGPPSALKRVEVAPDPMARRPANINAPALDAALTRGDNWFQQNFVIGPSQFEYYYLYTYERYQSFKELSNGSLSETADWYDLGVAHLQEKQFRDGSWYVQQDLPTPANTSFAILFLVRSTRKSLEKHQEQLLGSGLLLGGYGLPGRITDVRLQGGSITAKPMAGPADELLAILEDPNNPNHASAAAGLQAAVEVTDDATLSKQQARIRQLLGSGAPEARIAAIHALARLRNLDDVPIMIHALGDADVNVAAAAHDALRYMSRKLQGFGAQTISTEEERQAALRGWKEWYLSIRPTAQFED